MICYVSVMLICFHISTVFYHGSILKLQKYAPHFWPSVVLLYIFSKVHYGQSTVLVFFKYLVIYSCLLQEEKATIKSLAVKLSQHLVDHIKVNVFLNVLLEIPIHIHFLLHIFSHSICIVWKIEKVLCTKLCACACVCFLCQKSLPQLNEQIKKMLWDLRNELKKCEAGPPQDPRGAKQFLIQVRTSRI